MGMETLIANLAYAGLRRETIGGREFIVAPMTILKETVMQGSEGPIFYPRETNVRYATVWNGTPIIVRHPMKDGKPTLAKTPHVWVTSEVGRFYESKADDLGATHGEAWFPVDDLKRVDNSLYEWINAQKPMEVSVGVHLGAETHEVRNHDGTAYARTARSYRPDHIALLPDEKGACPVEKGCGLFVKNNDQTNTNVSVTTEQLNMEKDQLINWLVVNCDCWKGQGDKELLNGMSVEKLKQFKSNAEKAHETNQLVTNVRKELNIPDGTGIIDGIKAKVQTVQTQTPPPVVNAQQTQQTQVERLTAEERDTLAWAQAEQTRQKALLVERLVVNVAVEQRNAKGQKLMTKSMAELQELVELLPTVNNAHAVQGGQQFDFSKPIAQNYGNGYGYPPGNYALAGGAFVTNAGEPAPESLSDGMPGWDWSPNDNNNANK